MSKALTATGRECPPACTSQSTFNAFEKEPTAQQVAANGVSDHFVADSINAPAGQRPYQLIRYVICGVTAVLVRTVGFYIFSIWLPSDDALPNLDNYERALNHLNAITLAFIVSNLAAYLLSAKWVFVSGRHSRRKEFILFTVVSLGGLGLGFLAGPLLIALYGISHHLAFFNSLAMSLAVNFVGRKFFVFKE